MGRINPDIKLDTSMQNSYTSLKKQIENKSELYYTSI
jgi:hypothetical protein